MKNTHPSDFRERSISSVTRLLSAMVVQPNRMTRLFVRTLLVIGATLAICIATTKDEVMTALAMPVEPQNVSNRPNAANSTRSAFDKAVTEGKWIDAARLYVSLSRAPQRDPDLQRIKTNALPEFRKASAAADKQMRARLLAKINKNLGVKNPPPILFSCGLIEEAYCWPAYVSSGCEPICAASGDCSDACKTCISATVDGFFANCQPCVHGSCGSGGGAGGGGAGPKLGTLEGACLPKGNNPRGNIARQGEMQVCKTECGNFRNGFECHVLSCETKACGIN